MHAFSKAPANEEQTPVRVHVQHGAGQEVTSQRVPFALNPRKCWLQPPLDRLTEMKSRMSLNFLKLNENKLTGNLWVHFLVKAKVKSCFTDNNKEPNGTEGVKVPQHIPSVLL